MADSSYTPYESYKIPFTVDMIERSSRILGRSVGWLLHLDTELTDDEDHLLALYRQARAANAGDLVLGAVEGLTSSLRTK